MAIKFHEPGDEVTVQLVANGNGNVATEGDLVAIDGETSTHTQVALVATAGTAVAILARMPEEYDSSASYAAGDVVGEAKVLLRQPVDFVPTGGFAGAAGDKVVDAAGGGLRSFDSAGGDTGDMVLGQVWSTNTRGKEYVAGKTAVVRNK